MRSVFTSRAWQSALPVLTLAIILTVLSCSAPSSTGNAGSASAQKAPEVTPETQRSIATAIAVRAAEGGSSAASAPVAQAPRGVAEISRTAATSGLLDSKHLAAGKGCESCHDALPATGQPTIPSSAKCLTCHGGSNDALAARTTSLGNRNPHKAHTGPQDCDRCHHVHQPFEYSCNSCHTFPVPEKYLAGAPSQGSAEPAPAPTDGATRFKETED